MKLRVALLMVAVVVLLATSANTAKRVFHIDSYHEGFAWSDGITQAIQKALQGHDVSLKIHRMDTKRNPDERYKIRAAQIAKSVIGAYKPGIVPASDDNASKYLIKPYSFLGATRLASEQGEYVATTALKILNGTPIEDVPIVRNTEADIISNMRIARKPGLEIPKSFRKIASRIIE